MKTKLLVCDLDNTLYDWVRYFVTAFYAMVDEVVRVTHCDRSKLLDDFRAIHQKYHDSEQPFALLETDTVKHLFPDTPREQLAAYLDFAFYAFNSARKQSLSLYPGVKEGLNTLQNNGVIIVAHTESRLYGVVDRLTRLALTPYFRRIYCRERTAVNHPKNEAGQRWLAHFPMEKVKELHHHQRKPDATVLFEICESEGFLPEETAYVGDSMARDMLMAQMAGVRSIWARYGTFHPADLYEDLVRISHWTDEEVRREKSLREAASHITPDVILNVRFDEIISAVIDETSINFVHRAK